MPFKNECIIFKGIIKKDGYGSARSKYANNTRNAHRVAWENTFGPIPKRMVVMHLCDNRSCVNLKHLKLGTYKENIADMHQKGRWCDRSGEKHPMVKFTKEIVLKIKSLQDKFTQTELSKMFNCNQSTISRFINNRRWQRAFS
jgi:hypothetical protein